MSLLLIRLQYSATVDLPPSVYDKVLPFCIYFSCPGLSSLLVTTIPPPRSFTYLFLYKSVSYLYCCENFFGCKILSAFVNFHFGLTNQAKFQPLQPSRLKMPSFICSTTTSTSVRIMTVRRSKKSTLRKWLVKFCIALLQFLSLIHI